MTTSGGVRRLVRASGVLAVALAVLAAGGPPAQAHAFLESSDPADGSMLVTAPAELTLRLSEAVVLPATHVSLVGHDGRPVTLGAPRPGTDQPADAAEPEAAPEASAPTLVPAPVIEEEPPMAIVVPVLGAMATGSYRLTVDTLSADDMHRTTAVVVFGLGERVSAAGRTEPPMPVDQALLRWVALLGLAAALGHLLFERLTGGSPAALVVVRRTRRPVLVVLLVSTVAALALPLAQALGSSVPVGTVLAGTYGVRVALRVIGLLLLTAAVVRSPRHRRAVGALAVVGSLATATGTALLGHAGVAPIDPVHVGSDVVHVVATATWLGGVALVSVLAWAVRRGAVSGPEWRHVVRRFAAPATNCVVAIAISGLVLVGTSVASVDAIVLTSYGRTLVVKVGLVGLAALLGWRHARWARGSSGRRPPLTTMAEAGLLCGSLALAALLSSGQPAATPELSSAGDVSPSVVVDASADDLAEHVVVQPNRPGNNIAVVQVLDSRRPAPPRPTAVRVETVDSRGVVAASTGERLPGSGWSVPVRFESPGGSRLRIVVQRPGLPDAVSSISWVVGGASSPPATVVSRTPLGPLLRGLAGALTALALLAAVTLVARRRRAGLDTSVVPQWPPVPPAPQPDAESEPQRERERVEAVRSSG